VQKEAKYAIFKTKKLSVPGKQIALAFYAVFAYTERVGREANRALRRNKNEPIRNELNRH
jgi:hypothetical protein